MRDKEVLGRFRGGGLEYYRYRNAALCLLAFYCYLFLRTSVAPKIAEGLTALPSLSVAGVGIALAVFSVVRKGLIEEISIDHERGQVVKTRSLFGIDQVIPLANLEAITGIAMSGGDRSLIGSYDPCWIVYLLTERNRAVPIRCEARSFESVLSKEFEKLAERLGVPFTKSTDKERLSVDKITGKVKFAEPAKPLRTLRVALLVPSVVLVLGFYYLLGLLIWRGLLY